MKALIRGPLPSTFLSVRSSKIWFSTQLNSISTIKMCKTVDLLIDSLSIFVFPNYPFWAPKVFSLLLFNSLPNQIREREFKHETYLMNCCVHPGYWQKIWSSQGQQTQPSLLNLPVQKKRRIVAPVCPTTTRPLFGSLLPPPELRAGRAAALRREKWVISSSFVSVTSRFIGVIWNEWDALGVFFAASLACATRPNFEQDQVLTDTPSLGKISKECIDLDRSRGHWVEL